MSKFIEEKYIPELVKTMIKRVHPITEKEITQMVRAAYRRSKEEEKQIQKGIDKNKN